MRNKIIPISIFMLFMSAFLQHTTTYASGPSDTKAPMLTARLSGETLHVEAKDEDSGVEAVYIDGHKVIYPTKGALDAPLWNYAGAGQYVSIYAVDLAGNRSGAIQVENPYYKASLATKSRLAVSTSKTSESAVPAQTHPFTPEGTGTTVDNATKDDGKEFFTITTPDKNVFYLIVDRQRNSENVYFLNAVTEDDLRSLAKKGNSNGGMSVLPTPQTTTKPEATSKTEADSQQKKGGDSTLVFVLLAVAVAGGAGYYFKIYKPKHEATDLEEDDFDGDETEYEDVGSTLLPNKEDQDDFLSSEDDFGEFSEDDSENEDEDKK